MGAAAEGHAAPLEQWLAREREVMVIEERAGCGVARPDQVAGRSGLELMQAMDHFNPMGGIHGGWYATLLDSAALQLCSSAALQLCSSAARCTP